MRYRTIVADPPWDHSDGTGVNLASGAITHVPYRVMTVPAISALGETLTPCMADDAHLYLWTTRRYLPLAFSVVTAWGFDYVATLVWCKASRGFAPGGAFQNNVEFVLFGRRTGGLVTQEVGRWLRLQREAVGLRQKEVAAHWPSASGGLTGCVANWELGFHCPSLEQWADLKRIIGFSDDMDSQVQEVNAAKAVETVRSTSSWFQWPRGTHSAKPDAFLDLVEQVSPGPYLELFARRARFGWDYWGDESLGTAEMPGAAA